MKQPSERREKNEESVESVEETHLVTSPQSHVAVPHESQSIDVMQNHPSEQEKERVTGFHLGGYVQTNFNYLDQESGVLGGSGIDEQRVDFASRADLNFAWDLNDDIFAYIELVYDDQPESMVELEEAFISWRLNDRWNVKAGRFHQWIGWERFDANELWRINETYTIYNTGNVDGVELRYRWDDSVTSLCVYR